MQLKSKLPTELTVTIYAKFIDNMKRAKLDVNESTLVFEYPDLYYLDLNLKYLCDPNRGSAKFDKQKKTLTIRVPVVGMTEDTQKVLDKNFEEFQLAQQESRLRLKELEKTKLDDPELARKARRGELDNDENDGSAGNKTTQASEEKGQELDYGISDELLSKPKILPVFGEDEVDSELKSKNQQIEKKDEEKRDLATIRREDFLNIVKKDEKGDADVQDDTPDLSEGIKIKPDAPVKQRDPKKPLIQELPANETAYKQAPKKVEPKEEPFNWETAERLELKGQFLTQADFVFFNINAKGYDKN